MPHSFAHHELDCKQNVRTRRNDSDLEVCYMLTMASRRGIPKQGSSWYIREWMDYLGKKQRDMIDLCGWSKATASQLYNGKQDYSPALVKQAADALNLNYYELLMPPEKAMAIRRLQSSARDIVSLATLDGEKLAH